MQKTTSEALRAYFKRISGASPSLFNMAYAICGNYDLAEYALRSALLTVWQENPQSSLGLHEKLMGHVRRNAVRLALSKSGKSCECTWNELRHAESNPILDQAVQEAPEIRRCLVMHYGCNMPIKTIARISGISSAHLKNAFHRFEARARRRLPPKDRRHFEGMLHNAMEDFIRRSNADVPAAETLYRAFEAEAAEMPVNTHRISHIVGRILFFILAIFCALIFWLYAVISQPSVLLASASGGETAISQTSPSDFV